MGQAHGRVCMLLYKCFTLLCRTSAAGGLTSGVNRASMYTTIGLPKCPANQCCFQDAQVQQLKERASKEGQSALDADQRAKLATEDALIEEIRLLGGEV